MRHPRNNDWRWRGVVVVVRIFVLLQIPKWNCGTQLLRNDDLAQALVSVVVIVLGEEVPGEKVGKAVGRDVVTFQVCNDDGSVDEKTACSYVSSTNDGMAFVAVGVDETQEGP
eukprot:scaffold44648_cov290-Amphora_coffeaeformis.AAC.1